MIASVGRLFTAPVQRDPLGVHRKERYLSDGNGVDLGQVLALLNDLIATQTEMRRELADLRLRLDDLASQVASLRKEVASYHAAMVGHGVLISEHEARLRRVEQHLGLPPLK